jgi:hypothetical protein
MAKNQRTLGGAGVQDPSIIANLEYNPMAGSVKTSEVGRRLIPIRLANGTFTTDASTLRTMPVLGVNLAIYNNSGTIATVTLGKTSAVASLAAGVTDAAGDVGVPLMPNSWTYLACGMNQFVITSASTALVFIIEDLSYIVQEAATYQGS